MSATQTAGPIDLEAFIKSNDATVRINNSSITPRDTTFSSRATTPHQSRSPSPPSSLDDVPSNICRTDQLDTLPEECLSGDPERPLQHFDEAGNMAKYSLNPMVYAAIFVLMVEMMERLAFYGLNYTQASYLTVGRIV